MEAHLYDFIFGDSVCGMCCWRHVNKRAAGHFKRTVPLPGLPPSITSWHPCPRWDCCCLGKRLRLLCREPSKGGDNRLKLTVACSWPCEGVLGMEPTRHTVGMQIPAGIAPYIRRLSYAELLIFEASLASETACMKTLSLLPARMPLRWPADA